MKIQFINIISLISWLVIPKITILGTTIISVIISPALNTFYILYLISWQYRRQHCDGEHTHTHTHSEDGTWTRSETSVHDWRHGQDNTEKYCSRLLTHARHLTTVHLYRVYDIFCLGLSRRSFFFFEILSQSRSRPRFQQ